VEEAAAVSFDLEAAITAAETSKAMRTTGQNPCCRTEKSLVEGFCPLILMLSALVQRAAAE